MREDRAGCRHRGAVPGARSLAAPPVRGQRFPRRDVRAPARATVLLAGLPIPAGDEHRARLLPAHLRFGKRPSLAPAPAPARPRPRPRPLPLPLPLPPAPCPGSRLPAPGSRVITTRFSGNVDWRSARTTGMPPDRTASRRTAVSQRTKWRGRRSSGDARPAGRRPFLYDRFAPARVRDRCRQMKGGRPWHTR